MKEYVLPTGLMFLSLVAGCQRPDSNSTPTAADASVSTGTSDAAAWQDPAALAYEPLPQHGRVELSNLRIDKGLGGADSFSVDWRITAGEPYGTFLVVKQPGSSQTLEMGVTMWPNETSGTIDGSVQSYGGGSSGPSLASGCEVYMVTMEGDARHKISNSLTLGSASVSTTRQSPPEGVAQQPPPANVAFSDAELADLPADVVVPNGTKLAIFSEGNYRGVTVLESMPEGSLRIKWDDRDFAGVFPRASLKIPADTLAALPKRPSSSAAPDTPALRRSRRTDTRPPASSAAPDTPAPPSTVGDPVADSSLEPIPDDLTLPAGTPLRALYAQKWKPVTVLAEQSDGRLKIHWDGYSDSWDEAKPRVDLRIETAVLQKLRADQLVAP